MFNARAAPEVLDWLEAHGATVLGVDAFFLTNAETRPSLADSVDDGGIARARRHIEARADKPLFFEIVTDLDIQQVDQDA